MKAGQILKGTLSLFKSDPGKKVVRTARTQNLVPTMWSPSRQNKRTSVCRTCSGLSLCAVTRCLLDQVQLSLTTMRVLLAVWGQYDPRFFWERRMSTLNYECWHWITNVQSLNNECRLWILGCIYVGKCRSCKKTRVVQARPIKNPRKCFVFHRRFAAKARIETNFSRVYFPNGNAEMLQSSSSFLEFSNAKKRERSDHWASGTALIQGCNNHINNYITNRSQSKWSFPPGRWEVAGSSRTDVEWFTR